MPSAGETGLEVCPGREANNETALQTEWTDMDPIPGERAQLGCTPACRHSWTQSCSCRLTVTASCKAPKFYQLHVLTAATVWATHWRMGMIRTLAHAFSCRPSAMQQCLSAAFEQCKCGCRHHRGQHGRCSKTFQSWLSAQLVAQQLQLRLATCIQLISGAGKLGQRGC